MSQSETRLSRNLRNRHIQLIAFGGTIGVGLFLGSAKAIHNAGPALLVSYAVGGAAIFFIMRALGELLTYRPVAGSFASYADEFCGPFAGFVTGWSYWFMWVVTAMAELTAIGIYVRASSFCYPAMRLASSRGCSNASITLQAPGTALRAGSPRKAPPRLCVVTSCRRAAVMRCLGHRQGERKSRLSGPVSKAPQATFDNLTRGTHVAIRDKTLA